MRYQAKNLQTNFRVEVDISSHDTDQAWSLQMKYDVIIAAAIIAVGILLSTNYHAEHNRFMFVAKNGDGPPWDSN